MTRGYFPEEKVNELYPNALMIQPMGIWQIPNNKKDKTKEILDEIQNDYFAQVKKDGNWYAISITEDKIYLFARTISKKTGLLVEKSDNIPHIIEGFKELPAGTYIEGEIYYPNGNSDLVRTIMGCNAEKAIKRQEGYDEKYNKMVETKLDDKRIHFYIHNIVYYNHEDLSQKTNLERYELLKKIYNSLIDNQYIHLAEIYLPNEFNFYDLASKLIEEGEEGLVLKRIEGLYYPDQKKAWETIKLKKHDQLDVFCLGFTEPTMLYEGKCIETWKYWINKEETLKTYGECYKDKNNQLIPVTQDYYEGWIGAIKFGVYGEQGEIIQLGTVSSGLSDELKYEIKLNLEKDPNYYYLKPFSIECMEVYHDDSIRSPRFIKFREDLNEKDCTLAKIK